MDICDCEPASFLFQPLYRTDQCASFEAAWRGKNDKIKELTMAKWGPDGKHKPLQASVQDSMGFTAFAIAVYRRHFETAKLLLGIVDAQFLEPDKERSKRRYVMRHRDSEDDDSTDQDSEEGLDILSEVVDDTYTYDNIAALQDTVGSSVYGMFNDHRLGPDKFR